MDQKEQRKHAVSRTLEVALIRAYPDLKDGALEYLLAAGAKTMEWEDAITSGTTFDVAGCIVACRASEVGQLIFADQEFDNGRADHVAATRDMSPQDQINYARKHGLR